MNALCLFRGRGKGWRGSREKVEVNKLQREAELAWGVKSVSTAVETEQVDGQLLRLRWIELKGELGRTRERGGRTELSDEVQTSARCWSSVGVLKATMLACLDEFAFDEGCD